MSRITTLVEALTAEFATDVSFSASLPGTLRPNSVVVVPGDPFIVPHAAGPTPDEMRVRESWDVLAVASVKDFAQGIAQLRKLSLRVMRAVTPKGAVWESVTTPQEVSDNKSLVASVVRIAFIYSPQDELDPEGG